MYILTNARIFDGNDFLDNCNIIIEEDKIKSIIQNSQIPSGIEKIDLNGFLIAPGMIDLQINGAGGVLFNDNISMKTLDIIYKTCLRFGTTSFAPTLISASDEDIKAAVSCAIEFNKKNPFSIAALHIEGPYINKKKKGAHNGSFIRKLDGKMADFLRQKVNEIPIILTLAPEENDLSLIKQLVFDGIKVSIGHSCASYDEATLAFANGIDRATHLFNAMTSFESRNPGIVGAVLNNPVWAGIIIDGIHCNFSAVQIASKLKNDKLYIVSDAGAAMGTDLKEFNMGGQKVYIKDGKCINEEGVLAGSNIDMVSSLQNAIFNAGISIEQSLKMVSLYPAKSINKNLIMGQIQSGIIANLVIFDKNFNVKMTITNGIKVFEN